MSIYDRCEHCSKVGIMKGYDACDDCEVTETRPPEPKEPKESICRICESECLTSKMIEDGTGYICIECDEKEKRITP